MSLVILQRGMGHMLDTLVVKELRKYFMRGRRPLKAVDGVSVTIREGETLGLVGESGSGKSTLGRAVLRLIEPDTGEIIFDGEDIRRLDGEALRAKRRHMQIIFQDPLASLNPQMTIGQAIEDPLIIHNVGTTKERKERVMELLDIVGIGREFIDSFPHEFSGGQQQRVGIARALALNPKLIVCDEPVSALDVSIQAQIISLLEDLKERFRISYLFISHDLAVIKYISDMVAVMYLGKLMEVGPKGEIYGNPVHPYTRALLAAVPRIPRDGRPARRFASLQGEIPSPIDLPKGCRFKARCSFAVPACDEAEPEFKEVSPGHRVACHLV